MDFHQLKIFATVYKKKSFTRASDTLHISQPTISEHIKNLEGKFSCRLFDRLGRSIAPTQKADRLYPQVVLLLEELEKLSAEFIAEEGKVQGNLEIGASTIPGAYILPVHACGFRKLYPDTYFEIKIQDTSEITRKVVNHDLFCGIVGAKTENVPLIYEPLIDDELVFVIRKENMPSGELQPVDLCEIPMILREQGSGTRENMEILLGEVGVVPGSLNVSATLGSSSSVKEAVKAGLGASCLSRLAVTDELGRGELVELPVAGLTMKRNFYLITHKKRSLPHQYQMFCQYLAEYTTQK